jgi:hypothetical protein
VLDAFALVAAWRGVQRISQTAATAMNVAIKNILPFFAFT